MKPDELARRVFERYRTRNVYEIAETARLKIIYQRWHPVTVGELDRGAQTITVNENAGVEKERIIAHELGHFFLRFFEVKNVADEESFCDDFAKSLLKSE